MVIGMATIKLLSPKEFWNEVDSIFESVKKWALENCFYDNYQCCGLASDVFYRLVMDWGFKNYESEGLWMRVAFGEIRGKSHVWVEINGFIFDATTSQFESPVEPVEYDEGFYYYDDEAGDVKVMNAENIFKICKEIRPDLY